MAVSYADLTVFELVFDGIGGVGLSGIRVLSSAAIVKKSLGLNAVFETTSSVNGFNRCGFCKHHSNYIEKPSMES